jgi:hypothetical protein
MKNLDKMQNNIIEMSKRHDEKFKAIFSDKPEGKHKRDRSSKEQAGHPGSTPKH